MVHCRANMAHTRQSRLDSGRFKVFPLRSRVARTLPRWRHPGPLPSEYGAYKTVSMAHVRQSKPDGTCKTVGMAHVRQSKPDGTCKTASMAHARQSIWHMQDSCGLATIARLFMSLKFISLKYEPSSEPPHVSASNPPSLASSRSAAAQIWRV